MRQAHGTCLSQASRPHTCKTHLLVRGWSHEIPALLMSACEVQTPNSQRCILSQDFTYGISHLCLLFILILIRHAFQKSRQKICKSEIQLVSAFEALLFFFPLYFAIKICGNNLFEYLSVPTTEIHGTLRIRYETQLLKYMYYMLKM